MSDFLDRSSITPADPVRPADRWDIKQNDLITDWGSPVTWEKSYRCTLADTQGRPRYECPECAGFGHHYTDAKTIRVSATGMRFERRMLPGGDMISGMMHASVRRSDPVGQFDRFTFLQEVVIVTELMQRSEVQDVDRIRNPWWSTIIFIRNNDRVFVDGTDFTAAAGELRWIGERPNAGEWFSIRYQAHPQYVIIDPPQPRAAKQQQHVWSVVLRRRDLLENRWRDPS